MTEGTNPLATSPYRLGTWSVVAIIALRLAIGWHFFKEGSAKIQDPKPFSAAFFGSAKGPLAPFFHQLVWDADGNSRLDPEATEVVWTQYRDRAKNHYGFDADQIEKSEKIIKTRVEQLNSYLGANGEAITEYRWWLARRNQNQSAPERSEYRNVAVLKGQADKLETKLKADRAPWFAEVDKLSKDFERDIQNLATKEQAAKGIVRVEKPGRKWLDSESIDRVIPYFDFSVGCLLILGLFTRLASLTAAAFLASVVLSQFPGSTGAAPSYYQAVEMFALIFLAVVGAGQFGGLDVILSAFRSNSSRPVQAATR